MKNISKKLMCIALTFIMLSMAVIGVFADTSEQLFDVKYVQTSNVDEETDTYMIRFVGLSSIDNITCGMSIRVWQTEEGMTEFNFNSAAYAQKPTVKEFKTDECKLYDTLDGYEAGGIKGYTASEYGAAKFFAVAIDSIPTGMAYTFEITPFYLDGKDTIYGTKQYALFDASGRYLDGSGFANTVEWYSAPEYKVMSMNVLGKYDSDTDEDSTTEARMESIGNYVTDLQPDSFGIQEYGSRNAEFLPTYLPSKYKRVVFLNETTQYWISTFYDSSKYSVEDSNCVTLTTSSNQAYRFTWVVFRNVSDGSLAYIHGNLHLEYENAETRITNAGEVNAALTSIFANSEYAALPLCITGDFNATVNSEPNVFSTIAGSYNIEHSAGDNHQVTYPSGEIAIDHVLVNADTTDVLSHSVYTGISSASDHYPVVVTFKKK